MLAQTLQRLIDQRLTTAREIGELTGVAQSTVYRWINGESEPDFNTIRLLLRHLPDHAAQEAILSSFCMGTEWVYSRTKLDLDFNHDGRIDIEDALDACIQSVQSTAQSLERLRAAARDGTINSDDALALGTVLGDVMNQCSAARQIIGKVSERKRARALRLVE